MPNKTDEATSNKEAVTTILLKAKNLPSNTTLPKNRADNWKDQQSTHHFKNWSGLEGELTSLISKSEDSEYPLRLVRENPDLTIISLASGFEQTLVFAHNVKKVDDKHYALSGLNQQATISELLTTRLFNTSTKQAVKVPSPDDIFTKINENPLIYLEDITTKSDELVVTNSIIVSPYQLNLIIKAGALNGASLIDISKSLWRELVNQSTTEHTNWRENQRRKQEEGVDEDSMEIDEHTTEDDFFQKKSIQRLAPIALTFSIWSTCGKKENGLKPCTSEDLVSAQVQLNRLLSQEYPEKLQEKEVATGQPKPNETTTTIPFTPGTSKKTPTTTTGAPLGSTTTPTKTRTTTNSTGATPMLHRLNMGNSGQFAFGGATDNITQLGSSTSQGHHDPQVITQQLLLQNQESQNKLISTLAQVAEGMQNNFAGSSKPKIPDVIRQMICNASTVDGENPGELQPFVTDMFSAKQESWLVIHTAIKAGGVEANPSTNLVHALQKGELSSYSDAAPFSSFNIGPMSTKAMKNQVEKKNLKEMAIDYNTPLSEKDKETLFGNALTVARTIPQLKFKMQAFSILGAKYFGQLSIIAAELESIFEWIGEDETKLSKHQAQNNPLLTPMLEYCINDKVNQFLQEAQFGVPSIGSIDTSNIRTLVGGGLSQPSLPPFVTVHLEKKKRDRVNDKDEDDYNNDQRKKRNVRNEKQVSNLKMAAGKYKKVITPYMRDHPPPMFNGECQECMGYHCKGFCVSDCIRAASHNTPRGERLTNIRNYKKAAEEAAKD